MLNELYAEVKANSTDKYCVVGLWASTLSEEDRPAYEASLQDDDLTTKSLFQLYRRAGATFGLTSVREHRNGGCVCL